MVKSVEIIGYWTIKNSVQDSKIKPVPIHKLETIKTAMKIQRLKTGSIQLGEHTATEKHAGLEASRWQPHH